MYKKDGKYMPFPGSRDINLATGEEYTETESGIVVTPEQAYLDNIEKAKKLQNDEEVAINEYNKKITESFDDFKDIKLVGQKILFRPFKLSSKDKHGFYRDLAIMKQLPNTETMKRIPLSFPLQYRGVVCSVGNDCLVDFKDNIKVGDIVDIQTIAWEQQLYMMDRNLFNELEEPFTFWLTPGHIQAKIENYTV